MAGAPSKKPYDKNPSVITERSPEYKEIIKGEIDSINSIAWKALNESDKYESEEKELRMSLSICIKNIMLIPNNNVKYLMKIKYSKTYPKVKIIMPRRQRAMYTYLREEIKNHDKKHNFV